MKPYFKRPNRIGRNAILIIPQKIFSFQCILFPGAFELEFLQSKIIRHFDELLFHNIIIESADQLCIMHMGRELSVLSRTTYVHSCPFNL